jgi:hypothetical protein
VPPVRSGARRVVGTCADLLACAGPQSADGSVVNSGVRLSQDLLVAGHQALPSQSAHANMLTLIRKHPDSGWVTPRFLDAGPLPLER